MSAVIAAPAKKEQVACQHAPRAACVLTKLEAARQRACPKTQLAEVTSQMNKTFIDAAVDNKMSVRQLEQHQAC